ncbi:MAG: trigger factor [Verrucomicrobia bacterium]|nr:MAG: trigger factor [Verrucomicrobiota bacterium]
MNVVEEHQPNCLVTLHVEVPVERVAQEWDEVVDDFKKNVSLQGYRKGFAPKKLVEARFAKDIRQELQRKLLDSSLQEAIKSKNLEVVSILGFENIALEKGQSLRYSAKVATAPTFELPPYMGIELDIAALTVTDEQESRALENLRRAYASYEPVEGRGLEMDDLAVLTYSTQMDGKPLEAPEIPKRLKSGKNVWVRLNANMLLPGFSEALLGMRPDETRSFEIQVSSDYSVEVLRDQKIAFEVTLEGINKEVLPELSDEIADKVLPGKNLEDLKKLLRLRLEEEAQTMFESRKRQGVIEYLLSNVQAEVPSHLVRSEAQRILQEIVEENQTRGGDESQLRAQERDIVVFAEKSAQERVLGAFLLLKIAEKEKIEVTDEEYSARILKMAQRYNITVPKLIKNLTQKDAFGALREEILLDKTLSFIVANATTREPNTNQSDATVVAA